MRAIKYILFDCMETLVDLRVLPEPRDYAHWGFNGSGVEHLWSNFDEYFNHYERARRMLICERPMHKEESVEDRFEIICRLNPRINHDETKCNKVVRLLSSNYNTNYYAQCFVKEDVRDALPVIEERFRLGVVSNFKVLGGIESILEQQGLAPFFDFIVTSISVGWRKPHRAIYEAAIREAGIHPRDILFFGDDYENDLVGPKTMGMHALLLDRYDKHPDEAHRVRNFGALEQRLSTY